jgi:hypothetical protein
MTQTVEQALAAAALYTDDQIYKMVHLPAQALLAAAGVMAQIGEPFCAVIADKDEVTLVLKADDLQEYAHRLPGHVAAADDYRLITFGVELDPTLVGFMARISTALAAAKVTILPFAAFKRDHLLVPAAQFEQAMNALRNLQSGA